MSGCTDPEKISAGNENAILMMADACKTYMVTYQKLREFEDDLHRHVHLENNILFPKAQRCKDTELCVRK